MNGSNLNVNSLLVMKGYISQHLEDDWEVCIGIGDNSIEVERNCDGDYSYNYDEERYSRDDLEEIARGMALFIGAKYKG